ncbi:hypothetical protein Aab01nite_67000 [Paractinoplanes abujensis]|uniref:Putative dithiol-disulfide oxidoreductase (DUF899 family) n=1 Tax=Paractinoplanes abujensis TaxID=882441 RepID=A0A7W7CYV6_9ACTN|nr:DUF899 domain-containing protein [Actinoplanes abujensis]MBB4695526.1 putative dithiol-disulfide oxidoreductase (DUF899 family) [Actinoplanes abujensis]GID23110.1 hypothetical protein Aab01nite_67000 [Actinoplanes abujensis]
MDETHALPAVVSRDEWLPARRELLAKEKQALRAKDELNTARRMLPMVRVDKDYRFEGPDGSVTLTDLFQGQRQLVVQHFMFHPDWAEGCGSCTAAVDELSEGLLRHLRARGTTYAVIARAPWGKLTAYGKKRGWSVPMFSSFGSEFNYDFNVTIDAAKAPVQFNYRGPEELRAAGFEWMLNEDEQPMEQPGMSCFLRSGDDVFHTYSTYGRGTEQTGGAYGILDMTALGRQEEWEEPKGRPETRRGPVPDFS